MAGKFVPDGIAEDWDRFTPRVRNLFENIAMVQFDHRMLAYTTLGAATVLLVAAKRMLPVLPRTVYTRAHMLAGMVFLQVRVATSAFIRNLHNIMG